jgi:very-short-patch-repair endonuclease
MPPKAISELDFVRAARVIFGARFDYSELRPIRGGLDYARIICRSHGPSKQLVSQHLKGAIGCPACKASARRLTRDEFVARARKVHKAKFDYHGTNYIDARTKVIVVCKKHGPFKVAPFLHLRGAGGCIGCKTGRLTTEQFIARSKRLFPGKYDYAETSFALTTDTIRIICPTHGSFEQLASNHLAGKEGCAKCAYQKRFGFARQSHVKLSGRSKRSRFELTKKRLSQEEFMERAMAAHGKRYDLSLAIYRTQYDAVSVRCGQHGLFTIAPQNLWKGGGCPNCARAERGMARRLTTEEFVLRANAVHGTKYTYMNTMYTTAKTKVSVTCGVHGDFSILPSNHLAGRGCYVCSQERQVVLLNSGARHSQEEVITRFNNVHGFKYDYSLVRYIRSIDPLQIGCPEHGLFDQAPVHHFDGKGCPKCAKEITRNANRLNEAEVIDRFQNLHGKRFDYSRFRYKDFKTKSVIGCRDTGHGFFEMSAQAHLEGKGCPACSQSKGERFIDEWLRESGYKFEREFSIPSAAGARGRLRFDFLISEHKVLIEFDGEQHFRPVTFFGSSKETALKVHGEINRRDKIKNIWAATNGYKLIRIRYDDDIREKLLGIESSLSDKRGRRLVARRPRS